MTKLKERRIGVGHKKQGIMIFPVKLQYVNLCQVIELYLYSWVLVFRSTKHSKTFTFTETRYMAAGSFSAFAMSSKKMPDKEFAFGICWIWSHFNSRVAKVVPCELPNRCFAFKNRSKKSLRSKAAAIW